MAETKLVYFSDISGAFDRVRTERLLEKCRLAGVGETILKFLRSYLSPRVAQVVVDGEVSKTFTLEDEVFQGTVLGPPLWNIFSLTLTQVLAMAQSVRANLPTI